jgi:hypothetical protein
LLLAHFGHFMGNMGQLPLADGFWEMAAGGDPT